MVTVVAERWVCIYIHSVCIYIYMVLYCAILFFFHVYLKFSIIKSLRKRRRKRMNGRRGRDREDLQYATLYKMPSRNRALISYPEVRKEYYSYE